MLRLPPSPTLFPYTTLFRSAPGAQGDRAGPGVVAEGAGQGPVAPGRVADGPLQVGALGAGGQLGIDPRSEEHTSELQSRQYLVCRLLLEKKKKNRTVYTTAN